MNDMYTGVNKQSNAMLLYGLAIHLIKGVENAMLNLDKRSLATFWFATIDAVLQLLWCRHSATNRVWGPNKSTHQFHKLLDKFISSSLCFRLSIVLAAHFQARRERRDTRALDAISQETVLETMKLEMTRLEM